MKHISYLLAGLFLCLAATSCTETDEPFTPKNYDVKGKVEKGPFISGSEINIQPMDAKLQVLGSMFNTSILDDMGNFVLGSQEFSTPYAEIMANGYFFNEVKGELSNGTLTLRAIVDLQDNTTVNVNVLTHLKYARIKNLVAAGKKFDEANAQAQKELLNSFGLGAYSKKEVSSFSITAGTDESAALVVVSSLLLMGRSEAALTEYLAKLSADFGQNGCFSEQMQAQLKSDKKELSYHLQNIRENIIERYQNLGITVNVKDLSQFVDWNNDGVAGNEVLKDNQEVIVDKSEVEVPNEGGEYTIKIKSPIALYLSAQLEGDNNLDLPAQDNVSSETLLNKLYEGEEAYLDKGVNCETVLNDNTLTIIVSPLQSRNDKYKTIYLYDYVGKEVGKVELKQEGNKNINEPTTDVPLLGADAEMFVASIAMNMVEGLSNYNLIEQHYNYNKITNSVKNYVTPNSNLINNAWSKLYKANAMILQLQKADERRLNVYGPYCRVLSAMCYSNLVYGWGDVPYYNDYDVMQESLNGMEWSRENKDYIFEELKNYLHEAIEYLPEKKNESLNGANGLFFMSKDVARVLLANIYLYEERYNDARHMLDMVINSGFYQLDESTNFQSSNEIYETGADVSKNVSVNESTEVIFALLNNSGAGSRSGVTITEATVIPYITLSDVYLAMIESCYMLGDQARGEQYLNTLIEAKKLTVTADNMLMKVKEIREKLLLYSGTYFSFLKRTRLAKDNCGIEDYQLLFPIPNSEINASKNMQQNDGY